jgi:hypothetical protein
MCPISDTTHSDAVSETPHAVDGAGLQLRETSTPEELRAVLKAKVEIVGRWRSRSGWLPIKYRAGGSAAQARYFASLAPFEQCQPHVGSCCNNGCRSDLDEPTLSAMRRHGELGPKMI